jgi:hypothetical protein
MEKVFLVVPIYDEFKAIDIDFTSKKDAEKYIKEHELPHADIEEVIPNRKLFFCDVMARIPHGLKFRFDLDGKVFKTISFNTDPEMPHLDELYTYWMRKGYILPYLRPMSSMTKKEFNEYMRFIKHSWEGIDKEEDDYYVKVKDVDIYTDWLLSHHFDYRGLIEKGLALEAPEDMYKTE